MTPTIQTMQLSFEQALAHLKAGKSVARVQFRDTCYVKAQFPTDTSMNTLPYLIMIKKVSKEDSVKTEIFPFDPSCESIFAEDWYILE